jgi:predicted transposase YbfD/YdcC
MVQAERHLGETITQETRYYLLSFSHAKTFAHAVRDHWELRTASIGCWMLLFVKMIRVCGEGHAPENLAVLRHIALNVLRQEKSARIDRIGQPPQSRLEHR